MLSTSIFASATLGAALTAVAAPVAGAMPIASQATIAQSEIRQYASALFQIMSIHKIADQRWQRAEPAERPVLRRQASAAISAILDRHGLSQSRFNQITAAVERQPALRRDVRQRVMREGLGYK